MPKAREPATAQELAATIGADLRGDGTTRITGAAPLEKAGPGDLTFLAGKGRRGLGRTAASAVILSADARGSCPCTALLAQRPEAAWARALERLFPPLELTPGIHYTASLGPEAWVDPEAQVDPYVVIGKGSRIEAGVWIGSETVVGPDCWIGAECWIGPNVTLYEGTEIGMRCRIHAGVVLGARGFGLASEAPGYREIPQVGRVVLEDDVEVGAGSTIDRATLEETRIGRGTKIDNLVQIGHNCWIGPNCVISGQAGISGSAEMGEGCVVAGQAGVAGHIRVAPGTTLTAKAGVTGEIRDPGVYSGFPHQPHAEWRRDVAALRRIRELWSRLEALERAVMPSREGGS